MSAEPTPVDGTFVSPLSGVAKLPQRSYRLRFTGREPDMARSKGTAAVGMALASVLRRARYSPKTVGRYVNMLERLHEHLLDARGVGLSPKALPTEDDLIGFAATIPFTYASQMQFVCAFKAYWSSAVMRNPDACPAKAVRVPPKPEMTCKAVTGDELDRVLSAASKEGPGVLAQVGLLYYGALRRFEVAELPRSADYSDWLRFMAKGARIRNVPITDELREILDAYYASRDDDSPWMFPGRMAGTHVSPATVWSNLRIVGAASGVRDLRPHRLRHTAGATMHDATGDLRGTAEFLGHSMSSLSVTAGYTMTKQQRLRELGSTLKRNPKRRRETA